MKLFNILITSQNKTLHNSDYVFKTKKEANIFMMGLYTGFRLSGLNPIYYTIKEIK